MHPLLALALELGARGHRAIVATHAVYRDKIESAGLEFRALRPDFDPGDIELNRQTMHPWRGSEAIIKGLLAVLPDTFADLQTAIQDADLFISHPIVFPAPMIAELTGIPWISFVLSPATMFSAYDPPFVFPWRWLNRVLFEHPQIRTYSQALLRVQCLNWAAPIFKMRAELGLNSGPNPLIEGQHSPLLVLALFSAAFAQPQPDWPIQTTQTGFLFYDTRKELAPDLADFLAEGFPPVVFTLGSAAVLNAGKFFTRSFEAARRMGTRAVLVAGPHARDMRRTPNIFVTDYAPFAELLPHASAVVHQGGIGTTAQTLRAGKPALVVPFAHDQPDNAARVVRLGAGRSVSRRRYTVDTAELELGALLGDPSYAAVPLQIADAIASDNSVAAAADAVEAALLPSVRQP